MGILKEYLRFSPLTQPQPLDDIDMLMRTDIDSSVVGPKQDMVDAKQLNAVSDTNGVST